MPVSPLRMPMVRSDDDIFFEKFQQYAQILKFPVSVSNFKSCVSVSEFLIKSQFRSRL